MKRLQKVRYVVVFCFVFLLVSGISYASDGLYEVQTDDGYILKMKRYRPTTNDEFNIGKQPILLFPGILCNMNEFLSHTPEERMNDYDKMELPDPLAKWAEGDQHIIDDPMRYYSLAYYLWDKGYDPWFANLRGTGRGEFQSDRGELNTNFEVWAALDVPACINKVYEVTDMHPFIGGHSTGAMVCYFYLQGIYFDPAELGNRYVPHVKSSVTLAQQRNDEIKGFIGLDPVAIPPFTDIGRLDAVLYPILALPLYLPVDGLVGNVLSPILPNRGIMLVATNLVFGIIDGMHNIYSRIFQEYPNFDIFGFANFWQVKNTDNFVQDYFARYGVSSTYLRCISQCLDFWMQDTIREHWMNGEENKNRVVVPPPNPAEDGYYYYKDHMDLMTVPAIVLLSANDSIVVADEVIEDIMGGKTVSMYDEYYIVPDTSHMDVAIGLNAPTFSFPKIGNWLADILGTPRPDEIDDGDDTPAGDMPDLPSAPVRSSQTSKGKGGDDSYCFIGTLN